MKVLLKKNISLIILSFMMLFNKFQKFFFSQKLAMFEKYSAINIDFRSLKNLTVVSGKLDKAYG